VCACVCACVCVIGFLFKVTQLFSGMHLRNLQ